MNTWPPNKDRKLPPTYLQPAEVEALLDACSQTRHAARNGALITFLYRTGAMISEALEVRLSDVDLSGSTVELRGGRRLADRKVAIDEPLHQALSEWLDERATLRFSDDWVFCSLSAHEGEHGTGTAMSAGTARHMLHDVARLAGLSGTRVHPQALRHSFAVELIGEGWPLPYIQRQLGITVFRNLDTFMKNLDMPLPDENEVMAVIRTRVWDST